MRRRPDYRTSPGIVRAGVMARNLTVRALAGILHLSRTAIKELMRREVPVTYRTACKLRELFGSKVIIDETGNPPEKE